MSNLQAIVSDVPPLSEAVCADWAAVTRPWLCPLSGFSLIRACGKDTFDFLNNQLTNDLKSIAEGNRSQLSAYCNPQGRLYDVFHVFMRGEDYLMRTTSATLSSTLKRLRLFVLRSEVTLEENDLLNSTALGGIGLIGRDAALLLDEAGLPVPAEVFDLAQRDSCTVIRSPGVCERYEIYAPPTQLASVWSALSPNTHPRDGVWRLYDILSGIANIYPQTSQLFVPQMVNLDLLGALSFSKGCYPGQEVVARMHYLGKLKRRMYRLFSASSNPAPGDAIFVPEYSREQPSGEVVDACKLPAGGCECLATLRMQHLQHEIIRFATADGARAQVKTLPYPVTAETQVSPISIDSVGDGVRADIPFMENKS